MGRLIARRCARKQFKIPGCPRINSRIDSQIDSHIDSRIDSRIDCAAHAH